MPLDLVEPYLGLELQPTLTPSHAQVLLGKPHISTASAFWLMDRKLGGTGSRTAIQPR